MDDTSELVAAELKRAAEDPPQTFEGHAQLFANLVEKYPPHESWRLDEYDLENLAAVLAAFNAPVPASLDIKRCVANLHISALRAFDSAPFTLEMKHLQNELNEDRGGWGYDLDDHGRLASFWYVPRGQHNRVVVLPFH